MLPTETSWSIAISRIDGIPDKARALALELKKHTVYIAWVKNLKIPFRVRREGIFALVCGGCPNNT